MLAKRLFFDIETSPNIGFFWQAGWKLNIGFENIIHERKIICVCYKWEGKKEVYSINWDSKQNDEKLLKKFVLIMNEADELVGHNGDKFDMAWIKTRCLFHNIDTRAGYTTIDTLKISRSKYKFNSNRLDYIARFLGIGCKKSTGFGLWKDIVLKKSEPAMKKMIEYCKGDVVLLEKVYLKLKNAIPVKNNYGYELSEDKRSCPECGSGGAMISMTRRTAAGTKKLTMKCNKCYKYFTITG